ncbi:type VII secretion AAA-ATPase EccA [Tsukamurella sp. 8F]|uniref:type VII secretion AAA-ATPase EccA n=1 Tax=unclassified Tsukamurella TaxID=2633480 RepID=UPI0023B96BA9|nr:MULTISPECIES: type VII secretion AAA-ATPase EccA [unclassified Tsukamurella]MDF0529890.1 type VII secretion AAA-ATPase EccA [Tsukamurella sp. 8J]MDF0588655.1 type VII secretion AAA-ATPase EccA [Tsukamurella sp. 8F]
MTVERAFCAGVAALGFPVAGFDAGVPDEAAARRAFAAACALDAGCGDAWLGRAAAGELTAEVLGALHLSADSVGRLQRRVGLTPPLTASFPTGMHVDYPIRDAATAHVAYAARLAADGAPADADTVLADVPYSPVAQYVRAVMYTGARRWADVLNQLDGATAWDDVYLRAAAAALAGSAAAQLGRFPQATRLLTAAESGPLPSAAASARFCRALVLREQGDESGARDLLERCRADGFDAAAAALDDTSYRLRIAPADEVATRADPWDPSSVPSAEEPGDDLLASAHAELARQTGLTEVKAQVARLESAVRLAQVRTGRGLASAPRSLHLAFTGPPGTGKTTVARIVARIYCAVGLLATDTVVEASRKDFVGRHLGETAIKTGALIDSALDGVLFIDEAYTLVQEGLSGGDAFGREAVDTLLARMENERDRLVVIIAGYDGEIERLFAANEGLRSRFARRIRFPSYSAAELAEIAESIARSRDSMLSGQAAILVEDACARLGDRIDGLGNGRFIRNLVESAEEEREMRLAARDLDAVDEAALMRIEAADIARALEQLARV